MARIVNLRKDIDLAFRKATSPEHIRQIAAQTATELLNETLAKNRAVAGKDVSYRQFVDGRENAPLTSVNTDHGNITFLFDAVQPMLAWIHERLVANSPVLTGRFQASHILLADGEEADFENPPPADQYIFVNTQPYARKIERGLSSKAHPQEGLYEVLAEQAKARFGNIAIIKPTYRSIVLPYVPLGGRRGGKAASAAKRSAHHIETETRNPAILILPR